MSKHTPEPWTSLPWNKIDSKDGVVMGREIGWVSDHDRDRAVTCVNSCAGLDDVEAEIRAMADAIESLYTAVQKHVGLRHAFEERGAEIARRWLARHGGGE